MPDALLDHLLAQIDVTRRTRDAYRKTRDVLVAAPLEMGGRTAALVMPALPAADALIARAEDELAALHLSAIARRARRRFVHLFVRRRGDTWPWCSLCGAVKSNDGLTGCKGRVRLGLRW